MNNLEETEIDDQIPSIDVYDINTWLTVAAFIFIVIMIAITPR